MIRIEIIIAATTTAITNGERNGGLGKIIFPRELVLNASIVTVLFTVSNPGEDSITSYVPGAREMLKLPFCALYSVPLMSNVALDG